MELLERSATMTGHEEPAWERTHIRVPRENDTFLVQPEAAVIVRHIEQLRKDSELPGSSQCRILDGALPAFRTSARSEIIAAASRWTSELLGRSVDVAVTSPLIMTGHQPELFHPGVFAKNIATSQLATRVGGIGLNLVVDNDLMANTRIRVPIGDRDNPGTSTIQFDAARAPIPWEEARVADMSLLESFAGRVAAAMRPWNIDPLVSECWPKVVDKARERLDKHQHASLAECLTVGRASLEHEWGLGNLELPISQLCETNAFRSFAAHILLRAEEFCRVYNQVLSEYRETYRLRSSSHPVPELGFQNGWCETPFWIWRADDPRRGRLFVRQVGETLELATAPESSGIVHSLTMRPDSSSDEAAAALQQLSNAGLRLRTRALTTTLFSRLCLGDVFVHGIGGAKYDAMTDRIASRFFGVSLPDYLTLSATIWLPLGDPYSVTTSDESRLRQMLRELQQNPQRHLGPHLSTDAQQLVTEKALLIAQQNSNTASTSSPEMSRQGHTRYRRFPEINRALAKLTGNQQNLIREELVQIEQHLAANRILTSREFSFCLYPAEAIQGLIAAQKSQFASPA
ncbi:MAG: hypothetical protein HQ518_24375 [Rhodopirellula sp.]|nr:hypothetical protein [Rhodopirellula sp.]